MIIDTGVETKPLYTANVTDYIHGNLHSLMESGGIEDDFFLDVSPDGK